MYKITCPNRLLSASLFTWCFWTNPNVFIRTECNRKSIFYVIDNSQACLRLSTVLEDVDFAEQGLSWGVLALVKDLLESKGTLQATYMLFFSHMDLSMLVATARPALRVPNSSLGVHISENTDTKIFHFDFSRWLNIVREKGMAVSWGYSVDMIWRQQGSKIGMAAGTDCIKIYLEKP